MTIPRNPVGGNLPPQLEIDELELGSLGKAGRVVVRNGAPRATIVLDGHSGKLDVGGRGAHGAVVVQDAESKSTIEMSGEQARVAVGGHGKSGLVSVKAPTGQPVAELLCLANESVVGVGQSGRPGRLTIYDEHAQPTVELRAAQASLTLGGHGENAEVSLRGTNNAAAVELLARSDEAVIGVGQSARPGRLTMYGPSGARVNLTAADAKLVLGGSGADGTVSVLGADGLALVELLGRKDECVLGLGQSGRPGRISVFGADRSEAVRIDGASGDIWLANADCAEDFDLELDDAEPGTVMVLSDSGGVRPCRAEYDCRVAGVVSGAGRYRPGLVLDRRPTGHKRVPIALMGKVFCRVDASVAPVRIGDLLTCSTREGHAMRASDPARSFGAVLGKALAPLTGVGLIPVLVALQ